MGGLNGHGNARGIATAQSVLAGGVRLTSDAGRERVLDQQNAGVDLVLDMPLRWGWATA
jgi:hypothetical protein